MSISQNMDISLLYPVDKTYIFSCDIVSAPGRLIPRQPLRGGGCEEADPPVSIRAATIPPRPVRRPFRKRNEAPRRERIGQRSWALRPPPHRPERAAPRQPDMPDLDEPVVRNRTLWRGSALPPRREAACQTSPADRNARSRKAIARSFQPGSNH